MSLVTPITARSGDDVSEHGAHPRHVALVASCGADGVGGLSSYIRTLAHQLEAHVAVQAVARFVTPNAPAGIEYEAEEAANARAVAFPTAILRPSGKTKLALRGLHKLVYRPVTRPLAIGIFNESFGASLQSLLSPTVEHIHFIGTGLELLSFTALREARRRGIGFSVLPAVHPKQWGDSECDVALYQQSDAVFCLSDYEQEHLLKQGVPQGCLVRCGLGPATNAVGNAARFRKKHSLGSRPLLLFIGRKDEGKGYPALRAALPHLVEAVPKVCLVEIGPEKGVAVTPAPTGSVLDLHIASEQEKADALAACDVFCMPSAGDSFGIVYAEAWSYRKPVIGGMAPAVRELITDNVNGFCTNQNPAEIAHIAARLLRDPALRERLGNAGYALQQSQYTWEAVTARHLAVWRAIWEGQGKK